MLLRVGIMLNQHINKEALHEWVGFDASLYWTRYFHGVHVHIHACTVAKFVAPFA